MQNQDNWKTIFPFYLQQLYITVRAVPINMAPHEEVKVNDWAEAELYRQI